MMFRYPRRVPPDEAEYQLIVAVEEAVRTTVPVPHLETLDAVGAAGALLQSPAPEFWRCAESFPGLNVIGCSDGDGWRRIRRTYRTMFHHLQRCTNILFQ